MASTNMPQLVPVNKQVFVQEPDPKLGPPPPEHPTTIILFGWGDCQLKHLLKFRDGFSVLFPHSRQVVVMAPISKAMHSDHAARTKDMTYVVEAAFPSSLPLAGSKDQRILVHAMSNTGAVNYATALNAYRELHGHAMPHALFALDSGPGSTKLTWDTLGRWSRAMTVGTAAWFPWPFAVTQVLWGVFIVAKMAWEAATGREGGALWTRRLAMRDEFAQKSTTRLYLYGRDDDLIAWQDIEGYMAESKREGWEVRGEMFEGSGHVGHMRMHGERYWKVIREAWEGALKRWQKA